MNICPALYVVSGPSATFDVISPSSTYTARMAMRLGTFARSVRDFHGGDGPVLQVDVRQIVLEHHLAATLGLCV